MPDPSPCAVAEQNAVRAYTHYQEVEADVAFAEAAMAAAIGAAATADAVAIRMAALEGAAIAAEIVTGGTATLAIGAAGIAVGVAILSTHAAAEVAHVALQRAHVYEGNAIEALSEAMDAWCDCERGHPDHAADAQVQGMLEDLDHEGPEVRDAVTEAEEAVEEAEHDVQDAGDAVDEAEQALEDEKDRPPMEFSEDDLAGII